MTTDISKATSSNPAGRTQTRSAPSAPSVIRAETGKFRDPSTGKAIDPFYFRFVSIEPGCRIQFVNRSKNPDAAWATAKTLAGKTPTIAEGRNVGVLVTSDEAKDLGFAPGDELELRQVDAEGNSSPSVKVTLTTSNSVVSDYFKFVTPQHSDEYDQLRAEAWKMIPGQKKAGPDEHEDAWDKQAEHLATAKMTVDLERVGKTGGTSPKVPVKLEPKEEGKKKDKANFKLGWPAYFHQEAGSRVYMAVGEPTVPIAPRAMDARTIGDEAGLAYPGWVKTNIPDDEPLSPNPAKWTRDQIRSVLKGAVFCELLGNYDAKTDQWASVEGQSVNADLDQTLRDYGVPTNRKWDRFKVGRQGFSLIPPMPPAHNVLYRDYVHGKIDLNEADFGAMFEVIENIQALSPEEFKEMFRELAEEVCKPPEEPKGKKSPLSAVTKLFKKETPPVTDADERDAAREAFLNEFSSTRTSDQTSTAPEATYKQYGDWHSPEEVMEGMLLKRDYIHVMFSDLVGDLTEERSVRENGTMSLRKRHWTAKHDISLTVKNWYAGGKGMELFNSITQKLGGKPKPMPAAEAQKLVDEAPFGSKK